MKDYMNLEKLPWKMPKWMEKYEKTFSNTGGNPVEELMNRSTGGMRDSNTYLWIFYWCTRSQVNMLIELHCKGLLNPYQEAPNDKRT